MTQITQSRKKSFSSFSYKEAFKALEIAELQPWTIAAEPVAIGDFFRQRLERLQRFDLDSNEVSKTLLIDAICEEGLEESPRLKIWKGAYLEGESTGGNVDYLVAERRAYLEAPLVCVIEAKKDDFEQGLAQCLVEMQACQWENQQFERAIAIFGIVTNGSNWKFYYLAVSGEVYGTLSYGLQNLGAILGVLRYIFARCENNLALTKIPD